MESKRAALILCLNGPQKMLKKMRCIKWKKKGFTWNVYINGAEWKVHIICVTTQCWYDNSSDLMKIGMLYHNCITFHLHFVRYQKVSKKKIERFSGQRRMSLFLLKLHQNLFQQMSWDSMWFTYKSVSKMSLNLIACPTSSIHTESTFVHVGIFSAPFTYTLQ